MIIGWKWFNEKDDPLIVGLDPQLISMLDMARDKAGIPFVITSGKRTAQQEAELKGGVKDSTHLLGLAVDLECNVDNALCLMLKGLFAAGFRRIGLYHDALFQPRHLHVDIGPMPDYPQDCMWLKLEEN